MANLSLVCPKPCRRWSASNLWVWPSALSGVCVCERERERESVGYGREHGEQRGQQHGEGDSSLSFWRLSFA